MDKSVMSTTSSTVLNLDVIPILLFVDPGRTDTSGTNMTYNVSSNDTRGLETSSGLHDYLLYQVTYYMAEYYLWIFLVFGVPGNLASIFTILTMSTVSSSKAHVAILALTDTVSIIVKVIYSQISEYHIQLTVSGCSLIMFIQQFSTVYANWVIVVMTSERFLAVWFPLRVGRMYTRRKAIVTLTFLAGVTSVVYLFFFWAWTEYYEEGYGYWCEIKPEYTGFVTEIFYWIDGIYYATLPWFLILIGNTLIITNVKRAMKIQRHLTNSFDQGGRKARDQRQITVMLVVVSVIFLLLHMPSAIFYIVRRSWTFEEETYEHAKFLFTARFIHVLADANHAVNFYLYFLSMSSFRRRFLDAIRCRDNKYTRPVGGSVSRTSHTFLHSTHHLSNVSRRNNNGVYSGYQRSSKNMEHAHPLETYKCNSNGHRVQNCHQSFTAFSEV